MQVDRDSARPTYGKTPPDHRFAGDNSAPNAADDREQGEETKPDDLNLLFKQFRELGEYLSYFVTAKTDSLKLSLRRIVLLVVMAALSFIAVGGLIVITAWLMLSGMAEGLGGLFGNRSWAGSLMTGLLLLASLGLGTYYTVSKRNNIARERTAQEYERRQARQRAEFGQNVADRATTTTTQKK
jgi:hypothetical protein